MKELQKAYKEHVLARIDLVRALVSADRYEDVLSLMFDRSGCPGDMCHVVDFGVKGGVGMLEQCTLEQAVVGLAEFRDGKAYMNMGGSLVELNDQKEMPEDV